MADELKDKFSLIVSNGSMNKMDRMDAFVSFLTGPAVAMVTTNLLSRGIDVPNVRLVINFDIPIHSKTYLFQATRSGRFGKIFTIYYLLILLLIIHCISISIRS